jgi:hypothetical protein
MKARNYRTMLTLIFSFSIPDACQDQTFSMLVFIEASSKQAYCTGKPKIPRENSKVQLRFV